MTSSNSSGNGALDLKIGETVLPLALVSSRERDRPSRSTTLGEFLGSAHRALRDLLLRRANPFEAFTIGQDIVSSLLNNEVGTRVLEEGCGVLFHRLWGGVAEFRLFSKLFLTSARFSTQASAKIEWEATGYTLAQYVNEFFILLRWYGKRKVSLLVLEEESPRDTERNTIFGFRIIHERIVRGLLGVEVVAGARLSGFAGEPLWFKIFFKEGCKTLKGSHSWSDVVTSVGSGTFATRVGGLLPLSPEVNRTIADEMRVFVPYSALRLQPGRQMVEVVGEIFSSRYGTVLSTSQAVELLIPVSAWESPTTSLSEGSRGLWREDPISGDCLSELEGKILDTTLELTVTGILSDRYGEEFELVVDLFDEEGFVIGDPIIFSPSELSLLSPYSVINQQ